MLARVKILQPTGEAEDNETWTEQHVFIPKSAIANIANPAVWIVADIHKGVGNAQLATLVLGEQEFDGWIEVLSGLSTGDRVITSDVNFKQGDVVQILGGQQNDSH
jgi:hypothetical protein